jgi:hypothetical protein
MKENFVGIKHCLNVSRDSPLLICCNKISKLFLTQHKSVDIKLENEDYTVTR